jgi:hypothetical protein
MNLWTFLDRNPQVVVFLVMAVLGVAGIAGAVVNEATKPAPCVCAEKETP